MRLHELARELKTTGKDVVEKLHELKQDVKNNPMTMLSPEQVDMARKAFEAFLAQAAAAAAKQAAPAAAPATVEAAPSPAAAPAAAPAGAGAKPAAEPVAAEAGEKPAQA